MVHLPVSSHHQKRLLLGYGALLVALTVGHLGWGTTDVDQTLLEAIVLGGLAVLVGVVIHRIVTAAFAPDLFETVVQWWFIGSVFVTAIAIPTTVYLGFGLASHEAVFGYQLALSLGGLGGLLIGYHEARLVTTARDSEQTETERRRLELLHEGTMVLLTADSTADIARLTAEAAKSILDHPYNVVRLLDDNGSLVPVAVTDELEADLGGERPTYAVGEETAGYAFQQRKPIVYDDVQALDDGIDRGRVRASMYLPLGDYGVLTISDPTPAAFDASETNLAEILTTTAGLAIERLEYERSLKAEKEKLEAFAGILSHDLRNPLNVAEGRLELAIEDGPNEHLAAVQDAHDRIQTLIDDLLSLAREGQAIDEFESVALGEAVDACWRTVETGDATLEMANDAVLRADPNRLQQLLENLVRNAVEHAGDAVTITVGADTAGFFVADDGPGIPESETEALFERGYTTSDTGTGLGLAIVEEIADAHGWTVAVTAGPGGGARFEFSGVELRSPEGIRR